MPYQKNELLPTLLSYSYGQKRQIDVPERSGNDEPSIEISPYATVFSGGTTGEGLFPAGVEATLDQVIDNLTAPNATKTANPIDWIFLIGAPGNGKSKAANYFVSQFGKKLSTASINRAANNTLRSDSMPDIMHGMDALIINDASVPRDDIAHQDPYGSLYYDIMDALENIQNPVSKSKFLFVNINRGILLEEFNKANTVHLPENDHHAATKDILMWLHEGESKNYSMNKLFSDYELTVHAVFLDSLSILEPTPTVNPSHPENTSPPYTTIGRLLPSDGEQTRQGTIFGKRIERLTSVNHWDQGGCRDHDTADLCEAHNICPFFNNAKWARNKQLRESLLSVFRAVEVVTGKRFTYRDLWGHLALAIIGSPDPTWIDSNAIHPCTWVHSQNDAIKQDQEYPSENTAQITMNLLSHRIYYNLFNIKQQHHIPLEPPATSFKTHEAVTKLANLAPSGGRSPQFDEGLATIDPSKDSDSWIRDPHDIMSALDCSTPDLLRNRFDSFKELPTDLIPAEAGSDIEKNVDILIQEELVKLLSGNPTYINQRRRYALYQWRYTVLLRQIGLASGNLCFKQPIDEWLTTQHEALHSGDRGDIYTNIIKGLTSIIKGTDEIRLDPSHPRTLLLDKEADKTIYISIPNNAIEVSAIAEMDKLFCQISFTRSAQIQPPRFPIDIRMAREAYNVYHSKSGQGFTDINPGEFARIERALAKILTESQATSDYRILALDDNANEIRVRSDSNNRFSVQTP